MPQWPYSKTTPDVARFDRPLVRHAPALRRVTVERVERLAPALVRVTLAGSELDGFESVGPDDHVKVFFPDATGRIALPQPPGAAASPGEIIARDYTPRALRPATSAGPAQLDLDFVLHAAAPHPADASGHPGTVTPVPLHGGPASAWADTAAPGNELVIGGPSTSRLVPADAEAVVLLADETGLPAVGRWLELLPDHVAVTALLEVADRSISGYFRDELRIRADILWLFREYGEGQLAAALRGLGPLGDAAYVFGAAEANALVPLRQHLRRTLGLPAAQVALSGYWRAPTTPSA
ncbi:siderophore-interacting protein [Herbiconiux sp. P18]|uniref:siderophore-interacting protein n=1 Tax=Herbiconiux liangxiaofengii TaxID=3342795 RepID=UPI003CF767FB